VRSPFKGRYDEDLACALYAEYETSKDPAILNELLAQLCPLIRMTFKRTISPKFRSSQDFLESNALLSVHRLVKLRELPTHPRVFTSYLQSAIRVRLLDSLREVSSEVFEYWKVCRSPESSEYVTHSDVERYVYLRQRRSIIRSTVRDRIRFDGTEHDACKIILDSKLGLKNVDPRVVRRLCNLSFGRTKFLTEYVDVLIRAASIEERVSD